MSGEKQDRVREIGHWDGRVQSVKLHQVLKKNSLDVDRWIDMDGWMDGWILMDGWMMNGQTWVHAWIDGWMDMDRTNG